MSIIRFLILFTFEILLNKEAMHQWKEEEEEEYNPDVYY